MRYKIENFLGEKVQLQPRVELYTHKDFMGKEIPGLAILLDVVDSKGEVTGAYPILTKSFGEIIAIKNAAYIDTNNCDFADQLLEQGIAIKTPFTKSSGFCTYPLWIFNEDVLKEIGGENYQKYSKDHDDYFAAMRGEVKTDEDTKESPSEENNELKM